MKFPRLVVLLLLLTVPLLLEVRPVQAQDQPTPSARAAFGLSVLVPGSGHYYASGGSWNGRATAFALAEAGLWTGLVATVVRRNDLITTYESLASTRAGAQLDGKSRSFFLNLANYRSSEAYRDAMLRARAWDQVAFVSDRVNQWEWRSEEDYQRFRSIRDDAETLGRRRSLIIAVMGANRLISGISAARMAGRIGRQSSLEMSLDTHPSADLPLVGLSVRW